MTTFWLALIITSALSALTLGAVQRHAETRGPRRTRRRPLPVEDRWTPRTRALFYALCLLAVLLIHDVWTVDGWAAVTGMALALGIKLTQRLRAAYIRERIAERAATRHLIEKGRRTAIAEGLAWPEPDGSILNVSDRGPSDHG